MNWVPVFQTSYLGGEKNRPALNMGNHFKGPVQNGGASTVIIHSLEFRYATLSEKISRFSMFSTAPCTPKTWHLDVITGRPVAGTVFISSGICMLVALYFICTIFTVFRSTALQKSRSLMSKPETCWINNRYSATIIFYKAPQYRVC